MKFILALIAIIGVVFAQWGETKIEQSLNKLYKAIDASGTPDGKVTKAEFTGYFKKFDPNGDGLDKEEFKKSLADVAPELEEALWREFDNDRDGKLITYAELESDFDEFDVNDDEKLSEVEFVEAIVLGMIFHDEIDSGEKDGKVTEQEFVDFFKKAAAKDGKDGLSVEELKDALGGKDKYPGYIVEKFYMLLDVNNAIKNKNSAQEEEIKKSFDAFNANNDGHLTVEEFRNAIMNGIVGQVFAKLDKDGNGKLTAENHPSIGWE